MLALARGQSTFGAGQRAESSLRKSLTVMARDPQKDGMTLRLQVAVLDLNVKGDPIQLEQVLLNLLINARQAMLGKGGSITVKAAASEAPGELRIQVIDTGPGIPEKLLPKIFDPFFTTKGTAKQGETKGTGLGPDLDLQRDHRAPSGPDRSRKPKSVKAPRSPLSCPPPSTTFPCPL